MNIWKSETASIGRRGLIQFLGGIATGAGVQHAASLPALASPLPAPRTGSGPLKVESFGAKGDGVHDDGPAISRALAAASQISIKLGFDAPVQVDLAFSRSYRVRTTINVSSNVHLNMNGSVLRGPIDGAPVIDRRTAAAGEADVEAQTAGACFSDDGTSVVYHPSFSGGTIEGFRYAFCARSTWANPEWTGIAFAFCNIGIFAYQGCQEPKLTNTICLVGCGATFVAAATCFTHANKYARQDNFFCDGFVYDNNGRQRDCAVSQPSFDQWFMKSILRPEQQSVVQGGTWTFPPQFARSAMLRPTGRNIYIPSRNRRLVFGFTVRRASSVNCSRGVALVGNPYGTSISNVSGENMFEKEKGSMVTLLLTNGYPSSGVITNVDAQMVTNPSRAAVEAVELPGIAVPNSKIVLTSITGSLVGKRHLRRL